MDLVKCGKITCLQAGWSQEGSVVAGVSTRNGGLSRPPYNSLNLSTNTDDPVYNVEGNRSTFLNEFGVSMHHLLLVKQVHGTDVLVVDSKNHDVSHFQDVAADAIVTNQPNLMIGVLVADCFPVILFDPIKKVSAAIHVGWRGAAQGIVGKAIDAMTEEFGCDIKEIKAMVGPGISADHYQVGKDVRDAFRAGQGNWNDIAEEVELGLWKLDIQRSIDLQLAAAGIVGKQREMSDLCTWKQRELFFSYRRDEGQTGRQLGFIMFQDNA